MAVRAVSADTTAVTGELLKVDASGGERTIAPPAAPQVGSRATVIKVDSSPNPVTWNGSTNDEPGAQIVTQWAGATFVWDGSVWLVYSVNIARGGGGGTASLEPTYALPVIREVVSDTADYNTPTLTLTTSEAVQAGDSVLLVHGADWNSDVNMRAPGGTVGAWDLVTNTGGGHSNPHIKTWEGVVPVAGAQTVTVAQAGPGSDTYNACLIVFEGPVTAELVESVLNSTATTAQPAPELAADGAGRMLLSAWQAVWVEGTNDTYAEPVSGMTTRALLHDPIDTGDPGAMLVATEPVTGPGPTGTRTATLTPAARRWCATSLLLTARTDPLGDVLDAVPSLEELQAGLALGTISTTVTFSLTAALINMRVPAFALVAASLAASDTNYWTVQLTRYRDGVATAIASRTTRASAPGGAIVAGTAWTFDLVPFDPDASRLRRGDVLGVTFTPTGSPGPITAAVATWRYEPGIAA